MEYQIMSDPTLLVLYAVRNRDGQYFRAKGYGGCGATWVDSLQKARIYPKPGPARRQVTFFATTYPSYGVPELVELHVKSVVAANETERVRKSIEKKAKAAAAWEERQAKRELERAQEKLDEAQREFERLKNAPKKAEQVRQQRNAGIWGVE
jgi:hypothetical protein